MSIKDQAKFPAGNSFRNYYILIAALSVIMYANTLKHDFVLDDVAVIQNNKFVKAGLKGIPDILTTFYWQGYWDSNAGLYRPLSLITFAVEHSLSPYNPFIPHFFNVFYYAIVCCLLFEFLCNVFNKLDRRFFLFAVLLFIVHPIHAEVVANIKSRDEILCLMFFLLCCRQLYKNEETTLKKTVLASIFFLLALLSKEGAIVFLPVIFLIDYMKENKVLSLIKKRAVLLMTSVAWFAWHQYVIFSANSPKITYTYMDNSLLASSSFIEQKATALGIFARYIFKSFVPYQLSYDYSYNQIPIIKIYSFFAIIGLITFIFLIYFAIKSFKSNSLVTFCIVMMLLPLLLTGNLFFNIGATMADRFLFIPTIGSCILICLLMFKLFSSDPKSGSSPVSLRLTLCVIMILFSIRTYTRNRDWSDNFTLFQNDVNDSPNSARVRYNNALVLQKLYGDKDITRAQKEYEVCLKIDPYYHDAIINLGEIYTKQKAYGAAINIYHRVLEKNKNNADMLGSMGYTFFKGGIKDSAIYYIKKAQLAGNTNSLLYNILGTSLFEKKNYSEAKSSFEKGLQKDSSNWEMYLNYGNVLAVTNDFEGARKAFQNSYELNMTNPQTLYFLAMTFKSLNDTVSANRCYNEYLRLLKK